MLAIEVEYLMGRAIATRVDERNEAEWPPHPQRLFSALVATNAELDLGNKGRAALEWLEELPPPAIKAESKPCFRQVAEHFVPVNDESIRPDKGKVDFRHPLDRRNRQSRFFPAVVLKDSRVIFQWENTPGLPAHEGALRQIVENLSYLGHSASPIRACLREQLTTPTLLPSEDGTIELRVPRRGRLRRLEAIHQLRQRDEGIQPPLGILANYSTPGLMGSAFSPRALTLRFSHGPRLSLNISLLLMQQLRKALLARLQTDIPVMFSGHDANGAPTRDAHLAIVPLADVGSRHADGDIKGAALILPRLASMHDRARLREVLYQPWKLHLGALGDLQVNLLDDATSPNLHALKTAHYYARASQWWATVTPIVLDQHPKKNRLTETQIISQSCERIGLPTPTEVHTGPASVFVGAPLAREFRGRTSQTENRLMRHAIVKFEQQVQGPILLGAGRFLGLGLLRGWKPAGEA